MEVDPFWDIFVWWYGRTVLLTSLPAYRHDKTMKLGFVPRETKRNLLFELHTSKIGEGVSSYAITFSKNMKNLQI